MDLHSSAFINRVEINLYSLLTSCMSVVNRAQVDSDALGYSALKSPPFENEIVSEAYQGSSIKSGTAWWLNISQVLISLIIWMVLGFAAGFLIGTISPR